ncbi:MAG: hypothetical protein Q9226_001755 [Calogaya cf. arnoldii]
MLGHARTTLAPSATFRQSSLCVVLLISHLLMTCVNTYAIDDSCKNYNGGDISADIQKAINEVQEMAAEADVRSLTEDQSTNNLLDVLFGIDRSRHDTATILQIQEEFGSIRNMAGSRISTTLRLAITLVSLVRDEQVQDYPDYTNPNINPFDPTYLASLPMVTAYGFSLCQKLAADNADLAVTNW